ncbi:uncharacterized protein LOC130744635 [Lotus japonicus]|uniref:uncharacterized protein LOC130744635 n=1 Tax=Lotus japonicus TaxID=34305 RepID=UPI00258A0046|nr:uncharacterized protein LOC130744635 [Lotus japonicus]
MAGGSSNRGCRGGKGRGSPRQKKGKHVVPEHGTCEKPTYDPTSWWGEKFPDNFKFRPIARNLVNVHVWHSGKLVSEPSLDYLNGICFTVDKWDVDEINSIDLGKVVKRLGYVSFNIWYRHPDFGLSSGCKPFRDDGDVVAFLNDVKGHSEVDFYVEHLVEEVPELVDDFQFLEYTQAGQGEGVKENGEGSVGEGSVEGLNDGQGGSGEGQNEIVYEDCEVVGEGVNEGQNEIVNEDCEVVGEAVNEGQHEILNEDCDVAGEGLDEGQHEILNEDCQVAGEGLDEGQHEILNEDCQVAGEGLDGKDDSEISLDDSDFDEKWEWSKVLPTFGSVDEDQVATKDKNPACLDEFANEDGASDDLETPPDSDDEIGQQRKKFPIFKLPPDGAEVKFVVGQKFTTSKLFKTAIKEYALQRRKNVIVEKSDSKRVVIKCEGECPFYCRLSKYEQNNFWQIVSLVDEHSCYRTSKNRHARPKLLAKKLMQTIRHNPGMKCKSVVAEGQLRWGVVLNRFQASRIRTAAKKMIDGAEQEQYKHLRSYANELLRSNPNSTVIIKSEMGADGPVFQRIYVCFAACRMAFARHCRPLIGLDGCFLKGVYGGQLLTAVGKDGNNQMFPIAFAVVEAETRDSWEWFVSLLLDDLNTIQSRRWSFISDQQKGLVPTLAALSEDVDHRVCVRHVYGNWRKKYPGEEMKNALWSAARSCTVPQFDRAMQKLKEMNEEAWKDLCEIPLKQWAKAHFSTHSLCDLQVNNMCEAFNMAILEHRDKPIISLIEGLKHYISSRIVKQRDLMLRYKGNICPMIQEKLEAHKLAAQNWAPHWNGDTLNSKFEVTDGTNKYRVELAKNHCACRRWDLTGIPCCHAIPCMWHNRTHPEEYVDNYYRRDTFLSTYAYIIEPNNGLMLWSVSDLPPLNPPYVRRAPGRPKTQRNKKNDEPRNPYKLARNQTKVKCSRCGKWGHNIRTCGGKTGADREIEKGGNKQNSKKTHPKPRTRSARTADAPLKPTYKPAAKGKRKTKASEPTASQPMTAQANGSQANASQPQSQANGSQPNASQPHSQGSTITASLPPAGVARRGRKRSRAGLGTQKSTS